jgi:hypothetical protein
LSLFTRFRRRPAPQPGTGRPRRAVGRVLTVLAAALVFLALVVPDQITRLPPGASVPAAFVRLPIEALAGLALLLALPGRARRVVAGVLGALLGLLTIIKIIDMGFFTVLARPFDPVLDWPLFADGYRFVKGSVGRPGAVAAVAGAILLAVAALVLMTLAVRHLAAVAARHRTAGTRGVAAACVVWLACAQQGTSFVPGVYVASDSAAVLAHDNVLKVPAAVQDRRRFAAEARDDAIGDVPFIPGPGTSGRSSAQSVTPDRGTTSALPPRGATGPHLTGAHPAGRSHRSAPDRGITRRHGFTSGLGAGRLRARPAREALRSGRRCPGIAPTGHQ